MNLFRFFFSNPSLSEEAFFAYYHRLPNKIQVRWFRDGKYIVGEVNDGEKKFYTQGKDADDFINMVNESLITCYNIPSEYIESLKSVKHFKPSPKEKRQLENASITKGKFGLQKIKEKSLKYA